MAFQNLSEFGDALDLRHIAEAAVLRQAAVGVGNEVGVVEDVGVRDPERLERRAEFALAQPRQFGLRAEAERSA